MMVLVALGLARMLTLANSLDKGDMPSEPWREGVHERAWIGEE